MVPGSEGSWKLKLPVPSPQELLTINFAVTAKTLQGKDIRPSVPSLVLNTQTLAELTAPPAEKAPPPPPKEEAHKAEPPPSRPPKRLSRRPPKSPTGW
ncbi:hypothetical protein [Methylogaea oryzae]|uniref:hypothetical protein n=1 Tax=Methylogaea oryzae TaxID=1295382 RepID=UPI0006CFADBF|nr:hypothetical protein [Methylogaea oryzae]